MIIDDPLREALEREGHRMTAPRRAVWDVVSTAERHLTADEIAARVRAEHPDVNLSSVYRSLTLFSELGLVRESSLDSGGPAHWEPAHPDDEFHLRCRRCGKVDHHTGDLVGRVREHLEAEHGWVTEQVELLVTGLCPDCA
ncbi:MAG: transcriptional repressor [Acidimicrobiales bacterium]|nr:transcriptional repressor [Acidimicrobiales bacterium]HLV89887.1 Fur family transcriptional regulator [Acidimicrobiia bacterium]